MANFPEPMGIMGQLSLVADIDRLLALSLDDVSDGALRGLKLLRGLSSAWAKFARRGLAMRPRESDLVVLMPPSVALKTGRPGSRPRCTAATDEREISAGPAGRGRAVASEATDEARKDATFGCAVGKILGCSTFWLSRHATSSEYKETVLKQGIVPSINRTFNSPADLLMTTPSYHKFKLAFSTQTREPSAKFSRQFPASSTTGGLAILDFTTEVHDS
mmetsp:Transcript_109597/g.316883  ORF Transcript_109597/g.316883 Transcript_109597/m.316883 type:complete len:219 (-) Transcript_109597:43-699(-)